MKMLVVSQKVKNKGQSSGIRPAAAASGWLAQTCPARHDRYFELIAC